MAMVGDGSAMYSIQALWTAAHLKLPLTYVIANNRSYRILKERLKSMRGSERYIGMDLREPEIDFVGLAQSMGVPARRITDPDEVVPALRAAMASGAPEPAGRAHRGRLRRLSRTPARRAPFAGRQLSAARTPQAVC